jgi:hypothetical protein
VRVAVQGHADRGVPEQVLDQLRVSTAREQESSARVPEIVPAYIGHTSTPEQLLEVPVHDVLGAQGSTLARSENEPVSSLRSLCLWSLRFSSAIV